MQPTLQDNQLMSKHRVLSFKPQLRLEWRGQDGQSEIEQPDHSASLGDSITSSTRMTFSVHTTICWTKPARRNVVPIEDARTPVRETNFEAARLGHDLVLDNSYWHPRGLSPGRLLNELLQRIRQFAILIGAALAQRSRYVLGHVANPTFGDIKANDAHRVLVLAFQQIVDDSFKIGAFNVFLAPGTTQAEV